MSEIFRIKKLEFVTSYSFELSDKDSIELNVILEDLRKFCAKRFDNIDHLMITGNTENA